MLPLVERNFQFVFTKRQYKCEYTHDEREKYYFPADQEVVRAIKRLNDSEAPGEVGINTFKAYTCKVVTFFLETWENP